MSLNCAEHVQLADTLHVARFTEDGSAPNGSHLRCYTVHQCTSMLPHTSQLPRNGPRRSELRMSSHEMHAIRTRHQSHASQRETPPSPPVPGKTGRKRRSRLAKPAAAILPRVALLRPGSLRLVGRGTVNRRTSAPAAAFGREMTQTCVGSTASRSISWWLELSHTMTCRSVELRWWHSRTSRSGEPPADPTNQP